MHCTPAGREPAPEHPPAGAHRAGPWNYHIAGGVAPRLRPLPLHRGTVMLSDDTGLRSTDMSIRKAQISMSDPRAGMTLPPAGQPVLRCRSHVIYLMVNCHDTMRGLFTCSGLHTDGVWHRPVDQHLEPAGYAGVCAPGAIFARLRCTSHVKCSVHGKHAPNGLHLPARMACSAAARCPVRNDLMPACADRHRSNVLHPVARLQRVPVSRHRSPGAHVCAHRWRSAPGGHSDRPPTPCLAARPLPARLTVLHLCSFCSMLCQWLLHDVMLTPSYALGSCQVLLLYWRIQYWARAFQPLNNRCACQPCRLCIFNRDTNV